MAESGELLLRVFTHPACAGCNTAVRHAWQLAERTPGLELRTIGLERSEGLAEARAERVTTIPTLILSSAGRELERWTGNPEPEELAAGVAGAFVAVR